MESKIKISTNNDHLTLEEFIYIRKRGYHLPRNFNHIESKFYSMSTDAKYLYMILFDRAKLYFSYNIVDENNKYYFEFSHNEIIKVTNWDNLKIDAVLNELEKYNLIKIVIFQLGNSNRFYLKNTINENLKEKILKEEIEFSLKIKSKKK